MSNVYNLYTHGEILININDHLLQNIHLKTIMERIQQIVKQGNYIQQYERMVKRYPMAVHQTVESLSLLTFLIPGRFGDAEIMSEGTYVLFNLLHLYHGRISDRDRKRTGGEAWAWRGILTVLHEAGVIAEMLALTRGGEDRRWRTITIIEVLKLIIRARINFFSYFTGSGYDLQMLADGGRFSPPLIPSVQQQGRGRGEQPVGRSPLQQRDRLKMGAKVRSWRRQSSDNLVYDAIRKRSKRLLFLGESLHLLRPLIYVGLRRRFGGDSWVPWLLSCILDVFSIRISNTGIKQCRENDINVSTTDVNTTNSAEIQRRYMSLLMYFMRDPLYQVFSGPIFESIFGTLAKIPLLGFFFEYFLDMLDYMKRYYFFWSGI